MAVRKTGAQRAGNSGRKPPGKTAPQGRPGRVSVSMVFWILFFIVLITAFFALLPTVRRNSSEQKQVATEQPSSREPASPEKPPVAPQNPRQEAPVITKPPEVQRPPVVPENTPPEKPVEQTPSQPASQPVATQPSVTPPTTTQPVAAPIEKPPETRDRSIYFMQEARGGAELLVVKVNRKIPVSDSPLFDCLNALLAGPTAEEKNRNIVNLIPPNTRILSALVRGNTAYINFNNAFQYNTDGREGFDAQLKQIVWTATEFANVHDVQILIEGNRVDFLGEGIMIGSPLRR